MADKKYYWIRLKTDFFDQDTIDFLMGQENGAKYVVIYQMLMLKTAQQGGLLATQTSDLIIPYDVKKIVRDTKYFDFDTVTIALELFKKLGLVYEEENNILKLTEVEKLVGSEGKSAQWMRNKRARDNAHKQITTSSQTTSHSDREIDIDKDIDKEKNKEIEKKAKHKYGEYKNVLLTDDEYQKLFNEYSNADELITYLDEYIEMKGYKAKSHYLAIRKWVVDAVKRKNYNKTDTSNPFLSMLMKEGTE